MCLSLVECAVVVVHVHSVSIPVIPLKSRLTGLFFYSPPPWCCGPTRAMASFLRFLDHTQRHITVGRTPLDAWSVRRRDLYLTTLTTDRQTSMPPAGFEPTISASKRPQTYALDHAVTGTSNRFIIAKNKRTKNNYIWICFERTDSAK